MRAFSIFSFASCSAYDTCTLAVSALALAWAALFADALLLLVLDGNNLMLDHVAIIPFVETPVKSDKRDILVPSESRSMRPKEFLWSICCCRCPGLVRTARKHRLYSRKIMVYNALESARDLKQNLWSSPCDSSHSQADDDRELLDLLYKREEADKGSESWQKLDSDIDTLRQSQRQQENCWKWILEDLGFQHEADTLLVVTKSSIIHSQDLYPAQEMIRRLSKDSSIFLNECQVPERYLIGMDRLLALDAAENFLWKASQRYPRDDEQTARPEF
ncbi:melanoregulin [Hemitrygon akajei]|uniref:melanoregulin n=1 Tax=Hemitrygon akajei TaxID=2704970 RepID=UPI003BFA05E8